MKEIFGITCAAATVLIILVHGVIMMVSPQRWRALPRWFNMAQSFRGTQPLDRQERLQIRLLGALFTGLLIWMMYRVVIHP